MRRVLSGAAAERGLVLLVVALAASLTVASALAAGWLRSSADRMAEQVFASAPHAATQVQVSYVQATATEVPASAAGRVHEALPPAMRAAYRTPRQVVVTPEMSPRILPVRSAEPSYVAVAGFPVPERLVDLVDGRMPRPGGAVRTLPPRVAADYDGPPRAAVVEVVLQESAAERMEMPVGTWVSLSSVRLRLDADRAAVLRVVGTFRAAEPYPTALDDVGNARTPSISVLPEFNLVRATALAADDTTVLRAPWEDPADVRFTSDLAGVPPAEAAPALVEQARRTELQTWPEVVPAALGARANAGIGDVAAAVAGQRTASNGLVALVLTALAAAGLAVLLAAAVVLAGRRGAVTTVVRARGASVPWLVGLRGGEALLLVLPGLLVAAVVALLGPAPVPGLAASASAAVACAALVTAAQAVPRAGGVLGTVLGDALQVVLVVLAAGAVAYVLLAGRVASGDPVLLAVPPLVGAAAAVVATWLLRVLLTRLRRLAGRGVSAAAVAGLGEAVTTARRVLLASTAVAVALAAGVLSVAVADTVRAGAVRAGWDRVGADLAVVTGVARDDTVEALRVLPGVREVAPVVTAARVALETRTGVEPVLVVAVDAAAYARVAEDPPALPSARAGDVAAVASPDLVLADESATLRYAQAEVPLRVSGRAATVPGIAAGEPFVLVDRATLASAVDRNLDTYDRLLVAGDPDPSAVASVVDTVDPQAQVLDRRRVTRGLLAAPAVVRTGDLLAVAGVAALLLAAFAGLLVVGLGGRARRRTSAVLHALGADRGQRLRAAALGLAPVLLTACLAGLAAGAVLALVAGDGFDPSGLTGADASLPVLPSPASAVLLAAAVAALVLLAGLAGLTRRAGDPGGVVDPPEAT